MAERGSNEADFSTPEWGVVWGWADVQCIQGMGEHPGGRRPEGNGGPRGLGQGAWTSSPGH